MTADVSRTQSRQEPASLGEVTTAFARIGMLSFGGPAAQIALMHKVVVDEKKWLPEDRFLHALNYCMLLPGPEAMQLATYIGWLLQGVRGGLIAGALFILPGYLVLLGLATLYVTLGDVPAVEGLLFGLQAAVLAIVLQALIKLSQKTLTSPLSAALALAAFMALYVFDLPFPLVIAVAALLGVAVWGRGDGTRLDQPVADNAARNASSFRAAIVCLGLWLVPLALLVLGLGLQSLWSRQALFFSWTAIITFGGAYAVLAYITQVVVQDFAWLSTTDMVTGLGLAESTPGPLILVLVFVGYVAAAQAGLGIDPVLAGILGGMLTLWFTFIPCFVWIFLGAPFVERTREIVWLKNALRGVTSAVVGVIASLAVWFAIQVLFDVVSSTQFGPARLPAPMLSSINVPALAIAAVAGVLLLGLKRGLFTTLGICAALGVALTLFG
ncbi:MAG: chromate efflux transporter [Hyphomicrobiales bacterium]|jgi:chromate transporter